MVGGVGFEPTQPKGDRFTVCCDSPTSPSTQTLAEGRGLEPRLTESKSADLPLIYPSKISAG